MIYAGHFKDLLSQWAANSKVPLSFGKLMKRNTAKTASTQQPPAPPTATLPKVRVVWVGDLCSIRNWNAVPKVRALLRVGAVRDCELCCLRVSYEARAWAV